MANMLLKRNLSYYSDKVRKFGLSPEIIGACCDEPPQVVQAMLDGKVELPLHVRAFFSLYSGASTDSRQAIMRAVREAAQITDETEWRPIPGYERYEASNLGQVRVARRRNGDPLGLILKPSFARTGHSNVSVYDETGKQHRTGVHRLVALAFHGHPKPPHTLVRHLNGDPTDNRKDNLKWGTFDENVADMVNHARNGKSVENPWNGANDPYFALKLRQKRKMLQRLARIRAK